MKNSILIMIAFLSLGLISAEGQITVQMNVEIGRYVTSDTACTKLWLSYHMDEDGDRLYTVKYKDETFKWRDFETFNYKGNLNDLYDLFSNQIKAERGTSVNVKVGKTKMTILTNEEGIKVLLNDDSCFRMNKISLDKLFNRN